MPRKPTAERKLEIEQAVLDLIAAEGTHGLTMARIAARIGVSEAALYRHFHGKLDIIYATISAAFDQVMNKLVHSAGSGNATTRLHRVFVAHLGFIEEHPGVARILFSDEVHFNAPELRRELNSRVGRLLQFVGDIIKASVESGELSSTIDTEAAAALYLGLIQTQLLLWSVNEKKGQLTSGADRLWKLYARALK
ncbi:MAG TPA: TetR family transcriptional regulator [Candidatus Acetothermia bacterium]|nr:TetR family transcriptional regulator [Candidatus Acetothermia bacterium]